MSLMSMSMLMSMSAVIVPSPTSQRYFSGTRSVYIPCSGCPGIVRVFKCSIRDIWSPCLHCSRWRCSGVSLLDIAGEGH